MKAQFVRGRKDLGPTTELAIQGNQILVKDMYVRVMTKEQYMSLDPRTRDLKDAKLWETWKIDRIDRTFETVYYLV